jgi:hypothetical protein
MNQIPHHDHSQPMEDELDPPAADFYRQVLHTLAGARVRFLVGGAFAHFFHTGIRRSTKDLDLFILREDFERIAEVVRMHGWRAELTYPHWLAKIHDGERFVDLIFNSGNGLTPVTEGWFRGNRQAEVLDVPVPIANVEDALLSKAFIMERERYDGGDVAHLLQANAATLDWQVLVERFGAHWRVLLAHLTLFGYVYPGERHHIPHQVMEQLMARMAQEMREPPAPSENVCAGTLLSRAQYLHDVSEGGYVDGRLTPASTMTDRDVAAWTDAIEEEKNGGG